jgi:hypothetical protein
MRQRTWVLTAMASVVFLSLAPAQTPVYKAEGTPDAIPIDFELTSDGSQALVRGLALGGSINDVISVWETPGGTKVAGSSPTPGSFCSSALAAQPSTWPSDAVRVVDNSKGVLIANHPSLAKILVDVVDMATPACLQNFALPTTTQIQLYELSGQAHDLDITPDGKYAVVNCRNWLFVVDLSATPVSVVLSLNTGWPSTLGGPGPSWVSGDVDVGGAVDSVVVTNERGIVVQGASDGSGFFPIVWLLDLTASPPVAYLVDLRQPILDLNPPHGLFDPHDVAISPPEYQGAPNLAMVTFDFGVALFDLGAISSPSLNPVGIHLDDYQRRYDFQVDSVEVTRDHAVVIGYLPGTPPLMSIKDFKMSQVSEPPIFTLIDEYTEENVIPHDLSIQEATDTAVIKAGNASTGKNVVLQSLSTSTPTWTSLSSAGTPYIDWTSFPSLPRTSKVSDSVLTASIRVGGVPFHYAVTLGGAKPVGSLIVARLDVITIASPLSQTTFSSSHATLDTMPTDLDYSNGMGRMFVRCEALPHEDSMQAAVSGRDVLVIKLGSSPSFEVGMSSGSAFIGGRGLIREQLDSMIINRARAMSISYDPDPNVNSGYVHTSTNP